MENINYTYFNRENNDSNSKKKRVIKKSYLRNISKFSNPNISRSNNSGLKGIYYIESSNKYKLTIDNIYIGCFDTIDEAIYYKNAGETMIIDNTELLINEPFDELDEQCFSIALLSLDDMII